MSEEKTESKLDDLLPEYDLSTLQGRERGKYATRYSEGTNLILLDSDVSEAFPDAPAVNGALRMLMEVARRQREAGK